MFHNSIIVLFQCLCNFWCDEVMTMAERRCERCGTTEGISNRGRRICGKCAIEGRERRRREREGAERAYRVHCECGKYAVAAKMAMVGEKGGTPVRLLMCERCLGLEMEMFGGRGVEMLAVGA